jgi:hypothetical protein
MTSPSVDDTELRDRAIKRLKKRRDFAAHLLVYVLVNSAFVALWVTTSQGFFWPIFLMVFWGIGLVMNAWDVWRGDTFTEKQISHEMDRLQTRK